MKEKKQILQKKKKKDNKLFEDSFEIIKQFKTFEKMK